MALNGSRLTGSTSFRYNASLRFYDADESAYVGFKSTATITSSVEWTLPTADSSGTQALVSNGSGVLSWASFGTGSGTVTSVALSLPSFITVSGSPVTSSGTLTGTLATQTANTIFAGPSSGGALAPTFRALVGDDMTSGTIPSGVTWGGAVIGSSYLSGAYTGITEVGVIEAGTWSATQIQIAYGGTGQGTANAALNAFLPSQATHSGKYLKTDGTNTSWDTPSGGSGTVTSVGLTVPSFMSVSGSPVTTSGTLAVVLTTQTANMIFSGPASGGALAPTFRDLVSDDIPQMTPTKVASGAANGSLIVGSGTNSASWLAGPSVKKILRIDASNNVTWETSPNAWTAGGCTACRSVCCSPSAEEIGNGFSALITDLQALGILS